MKIKVGYTDWRVIPMNAELSASQWAAQACCIPANTTIQIRPDLTPQMQAASLIHELIHCCFFTYALPTGGMEEEDVCTRLEGPLTAVIRDNPKLFEVLRKALTEDKPIVL